MATETRMREDLSPEQAATFLGKSRAFVIDLIKANEIDFTNECSPNSKRPYYRITRAACVQWRESRRGRVQDQEPEMEPIRRGAMTGLLQMRRQRRAAKRAQQAAAHAH